MLQTSAEGEALIYSHVLRILELYLVAAKAKETLKKEKLTEKTNFVLSDTNLSVILNVSLCFL